MPGPTGRQPLSSITTITPRQPRSPPYPPMGPRPSSEWTRILEDDSGTTGKLMQREYPRIRPARGGKKENDIYSHLDTFTIHCGSSRHYAIVHSDVVLGQSPWLRARHESAMRHKPGALILRIPAHIVWWQVAWALEYMYQGSVRGFGFLACEEMPEDSPERPSRPIAWGMLQLWDVADFFGLQELKLRAEEAFKAYFRKTFRHSILAHRMRGAVVGWSRSEVRLVHEFWLAAWIIFDGAGRWPHYYFYFLPGLMDFSSEFSPTADNAQRALVAWENTMFDWEGASEDQGLLFEEYALPAPAPPSAVTFKPVMVDLCMDFVRSGLLEVEWFQTAMAAEVSMGLRVALAKKMRDPESVWPRDEYPGAPYSFVRVNPWRLAASNVREVPLRRAQYEETPMQQRH